MIDEEVEAEEGEVGRRLKSRWEERVEAEATARGLEQGLEQGQQVIVLRLLERRFGPLPDGLRNRLSGLSAIQTVDLAEALLDFSDHEDLDRWLAENAEQ